MSRHDDFAQSGRDQKDDALVATYRAAACAEADAHFDDRALESQRHKILARLAHLGHPARVIRFPKAPSGELPATGVNRRWISVAAAAGLLIGLLGGQLVHLVPQPARRVGPMATSTPPSAPSRSNFVPASVNVDDSLLNEIDLAVQLRSPSALRALAELTLGDDGQ
jgi:hypothetical protein